MPKRPARYAGVAAIALALSGAWWFTQRQPAAPAAAEAPAAAPKGDLLRVDPRHAAALGIADAPAAAAGDVPIASIPATIQPPANARVAVAATFPGVVMRTLVVEGDAVRRGQPLAVIASRDVLTLGADLARAQARLGYARANAARLAQLSREGIIAGARADEAGAAATEARVDAGEKARLLRMANADGGNGTYTLRAPIAGRVTSAAIQAGNPVDGTTAPFVIDAADRYEVVGQLPERLVGTVRTGMRATLEGIAAPAPASPPVAAASAAPASLSGRIVAVGTTIDPATRSASLKAEIPPAPGVVAGRATSLAVYGPAPAGAVTLPASALASVDGRDVVFVAAPGGYAIRRVTTGGTADGRVVLLGGVRPGERVVIHGTSALKALALAR